MKFKNILFATLCAALSAAPAASMAADGSIKTIYRSRSGGSGLADKRSMVSTDVKSAPSMRTAARPEIRKVPIGRSGSSAFIFHTFKLPKDRQA